MSITIPQWDAIKHKVTDEMLMYTRSFVSPLTVPVPETVRLTGTGGYVSWDTKRILLTCEHVAREQPVHYRFYGSQNVYEHPGPWVMDKHPFDVAFARMPDTLWAATRHQAAAVPSSLFAQRHKLSQQAELLFLRGYAGENAAYGFGVHQANGSGYCSQEVAGCGHGQIFELFWDPLKTQVTTGTPTDAASAMLFDNAQGLSGSLVWNTRYLETITAGQEWSPQDAVVTGLLRRWDTGTKTLLVWRVEHLLNWLAQRV